MRKRVLKAALTSGALSGVIVTALATGRSAGKFCFRTTGASGYLSLELPAVHGVRTNGYATELPTTVDGEDNQYDVAANSWAAVGEAAAPEGREHVLVEIVTSG
ncbi:hypothetical protein ACF1BK_00825 [Streptomyces globisporus]|uniref:hypothetical protein n=1 Tax=Streptomyces globisporus TaxID=1908 RepID=UPI0036F6AA5D